MQVQNYLAFDRVEPELASFDIEISIGITWVAYNFFF